MFATALLFLGEAYRFVIKHWRAVFIAFVVVALFVGVAMLKGCWTEHQITKTGETVTDDRIEEANNDAVSKTAAVEVERTTKTAQNARNEREKANKRDSKEYANTNAGERFCDRFPSDSTCQ